MELVASGVWEAPGQVAPPAHPMSSQPAPPSEPEQAPEPFAAALERLEPRAAETLQNALDARGHRVRDRWSKNVGRLRAVLVDRETGDPRWLGVQIARRSKVVGLPVSGVSFIDGDVWCSYPATQISQAPIIQRDHLSARTERELCLHYHLPLTPGASHGRWERRATSSAAFQDAAPERTIRWIPPPRSWDTSA